MLAINCYVIFTLLCCLLCLTRDRERLRAIILSDAQHMNGYRHNQRLVERLRVKLDEEIGAFWEITHEGVIQHCPSPPMQGLITDINNRDVFFRREDEL